MASIVNGQFAGELKVMVLGMVGVSVLAGFAATGAGLALDFPTWAVLIAYPVTGALSLLLMASFWSIRDQRLGSDPSLLALNTSPNARTN